MSQPLNADHRRIIAKETAICATASALLPPTGMWFTFGPWPMPFAGTAGFVVTMVKGTIVMVVLMTALMTLGIRQRVRKGDAPPLRLPAHRWVRLKPASIIARVPLFALAALVVFLPIGVLGMSALGYDSIDRLSFCVFNAIYGATVGLVMTPIIMASALSDQPLSAPAPAVTE